MSKVNRFLCSYGVGAVVSTIFVWYFSYSDMRSYSFNDFVIDCFFGCGIAYSVGLLIDAKFKLNELRKFMKDINDRKET